MAWRWSSIDQTMVELFRGGLIARGFRPAVHSLVVTTSARDVRSIRRADGPVVADVAVPPSKSITNRALICAALVDGTSEIVGVAPGDDTSALHRLSHHTRVRRSRSASPTTGTRRRRRRHERRVPAPADHVARQARRHHLAFRHGAGGARTAARSRSTAIRRCAAGRWSTCTTRSSPSAPRSSRGRSGDISRSPCRARCAAPTP